MLSNAYFLAKIRFDTAENEPVKKCVSFRRSAWEMQLEMQSGEGDEKRTEKGKCRAASWSLEAQELEWQSQTMCYVDLGTKESERDLKGKTGRTQARAFFFLIWAVQKSDSRPRGRRRGCFCC